MKKVFLLSLLFVIVFSSFADSRRVEESLHEAFSGYYPITFDVGVGGLLEGEQDAFDVIGSQEVKVAFSVKYELLSQYSTGLFFAYSQYMFWDLFAESSPFSEINYMPEFFFRFASGNNFFGNQHFYVFDYFQIGWQHKSNGQGAELSRGWDRFYADLMLGFEGEENYFGIGVRGFILFDDFFNNYFADLGIIYPVEPNNTDAREYMGVCEIFSTLDLSGIMPIIFPQRFQLALAPTDTPEVVGSYITWAQLDLFFANFGGFRPHAQVWYGYGEALITYNEPALSIRAGVALY
ncbi:MAG: phospholipase A [Spirochaetia bacterium]